VRSCEIYRNTDVARGEAESDESWRSVICNRNAESEETRYKRVLSGAIRVSAFNASDVEQGIAADVKEFPFSQIREKPTNRPSPNSVYCWVARFFAVLRWRGGCGGEGGIGAQLA